MPNSFYRWTGRSQDPAEQNLFLRYASRIGERNARRWAGKPYQSSLQTFGPPLIPMVGIGPELLMGRILMEDDVTPDPDSFIAEAIASGIPIEEEAETRYDPARRFLRLESVETMGLEFVLYDLCTERSLDFKFLRSDRYSFLDGRLVEARRGSSISSQYSELASQADWYVAAPSVTLRYYLERWILNFLAWAKFFVIPGLHYQRNPGWRNSELPAYEFYRARFDTLLVALGPDDACETVFEEVLAEFERDTDSWFGKRDVGES